MHFFHSFFPYTTKSLSCAEVYSFSLGALENHNDKSDCVVWTKTVHTVENLKQTSCESALVPCPKQCRGSEHKINHFTKEYIEKHLAKHCPNREYECDHCGEKGTYASITRVHDKTCEKKVVPCPNADCTDTIERRGIKRHLEDCAHTEVSCKYQKIGCDVKMKRNSLSAHEDEIKPHFNIVIKKVIALEEELAAIKSKEVFRFKIEDFAAKKNQNEVFFSPSFYTGLNGYHMDIMVVVNGDGRTKGTHISVFARLLGGKYDGQLSWPFVGDITFTLLNQLADENHFKRTSCIAKVCNVRSKSAINDWGFADFIPHSKLAPTGNTQYLRNNTLYFRVSVNIPHDKPWLE